jgi:DUF4097 and DUF4098 domain-containing protein YvlB
MKRTVEPPPPEGRNLTGFLLVALFVGLAALALAANAVVLTLAVSAATLPGATREAHVVPGDKVGVYNLVGEMRVVGGSGRDVTVDVATGGRSGGELRVESGVLDGVSTLRVIYPSNSIVYPALGRGGRTELHVREDGRFGDSSIGRALFNRRRVTLSGSGRGLEAHADLTVHVPPGKTLSVFLGAGQVEVSNVEGTLRVDVAAADVRSERTRGDLSIDTGSGRVEVRHAQGDLSVDTGSGEVIVSNTSGDRLLVDTGSGDVTVSDAQAPVISIDTGSGGVSLSSVRADDVNVDTGSGGVEIGLLSDIRSLLVDTGSGSVTIRAPSTLGAMLRIESSSGRIETDFTISLVRRDEDSLEGRIGDGRGRIAIETGSGGVRLARAR